MQKVFFGKILCKWPVSDNFIPSSKTLFGGMFKNWWFVIVWKTNKFNPIMTKQLNLQNKFCQKIKIQCLFSSLNLLANSVQRFALFPWYKFTKYLSRWKFIFSYLFLISYRLIIWLIFALIERSVFDSKAKLFEEYI